MCEHVIRYAVASSQRPSLKPKVRARTVFIILSLLAKFIWHVRVWHCRFCHRPKTKMLYVFIRWNQQQIFARTEKNIKKIHLLFGLFAIGREMRASHPMTTAVDFASGHNAHAPRITYGQQNGSFIINLIDAIILLYPFIELYYYSVIVESGVNFPVMRKTRATDT